MRLQPLPRLRGRRFWSHATGLFVDKWLHQSGGRPSLKVSGQRSHQVAREAVVMPSTERRREMKLTEHRPRRLFDGRAHCLKPARQLSFVVLGQARKPAVGPPRPASHDVCRHSGNSKA
jgi:hypothetical protein